MTDVFDLTQSTWTYTASASGLLKGTALPLPSGLMFTASAKPTHRVKYWAAKTRSFNFAE